MRTIVLATLSVMVGCGEPSVLDFRPIELTQSGGCANVFMFAVDSADTRVLTFDAREVLAAAQGATQTYVLPSEVMTVKLLTGRHLTTAYCNDVVKDEPVVRAEWKAVRGTIRLSATKVAGGGGDNARATLNAENLIISDGVSVSEPFNVELRDILVGWYAG
jgi:hypothetical protein